MNIYVIGCGGNYTNESGRITSPSHPNRYPHNSECIYLLSQAIGSVINITLINFDIVCPENGPTSEYLELRDGHSGESPLMGRFCGNGTNIPANLQSTQNFLRIRWDTCSCTQNITKSLPSFFNPPHSFM